MDFAFAVDRVRALDYLISALLCGAPPKPDKPSQTSNWLGLRKG